mgnify:FL=1
MVNIFNAAEKAFIKTKYKILFVASESAPFAQIGGLGGVIFSLSRALREIGQDARIMIPRYAGMDLEKFPLEMEYKELEVPTGGTPEFLICNVKKYERPDIPFTYFLENMEYYEKRANIYGYSDDSVRWALLSRGTLEFLRLSKWVPDVIVACDWHVGFLPNYLKTEYKEDPVLSKIATIFSIHNIFYQGMFDYKSVSEMDYDAGQAPIPDLFDPRLLKLNGMRRGIMYADVVNTVSPTYAQEILTAEFGEGLDALLRERRARVYGVLNGIDYRIFNPENDPYVPAHYNSRNIERREKNQIFLQKHFGLPQNKEAFVMSIVARLSEQKGIDLIMQIIEPLLANINFQLIVLGSGESEYLEFFKNIAEKHPKQIAVHPMFDTALRHLIYAGSDVVLVPSKFEPCGLTQMEAMRYGTIPIVRETGGLADTVEDFNPKEDTGTGFVFKKYDPWAFFTAVVRAREAFRYQQQWERLIKRAMARDFSWKNSAREYIHLFSVAREYHKEDLRL